MRLPILILPILLLAQPSCSTVSFYSQALHGQLEVFSKCKPIENVLASTEDETLQARLELTGRLLDFAKEHLDMPSNNSFRHYADLERKHVVWVVHATPELSMEPKTWWYPIVGRQGYRGYFRPDGADREIERLQAQGYETWTSGVDAYSTLGYLRDPLLNTYIMRDEADLAEIIFHELAHQRHYVPGETAFNEAMAEAVSRAGVRRWFQHTKRPQKARDYDERLRRLTLAGDAIQSSSDTLAAIYDSPLSDAQKRSAKSREITGLKSRLGRLRSDWGGKPLTSWIEGEINNARLNSFTTYESEVPRFARVIEESGFPEFWEAVKNVQP